MEKTADNAKRRAKLKRSLVYTYLIFGFIAIIIEMIIVKMYYPSYYLAASSMLYFVYAALNHTVHKYVIRQKTMLIFEIPLLAVLLALKWV